MNTIDAQYLNLVRKILDDGVDIKIGNTNRKTIFGHTIDINLEDGFPILTTKKVFWRGVVEELIWFLNGSTNVKELESKGVYIWSENALPDGTIGDSYGKQWRDWNGLDQIERCISLLKKYPKSTRNVVVAWNPQQIEKVALPPCHFSFQTLSENGKDLTLVVTKRSTDVSLGLPFNIASYALLTHLLANVTNMNPKRLIIQMSHCHIYEEHITTIKTQFYRQPYNLPTLHLVSHIPDNLKNLQSEWFTLSDYIYHPAIQMKMIKT
jgi:thymidylate synthase